MKFAVLDFETTGSQATDNIIQAGLALIENGKITELYGTLVYTEQRIPAEIVQLTGISNEHLIDAPSLPEVMDVLSAKLKDAVLVAHNAGFDVGFLQRSLQRCQMPRFSGRVLDSVELARICFPSVPSLNLGMLAAHFQIEHNRPHQADSDAYATAEVWLRCLHRIQQWPLLVIQRIDDVLRRFTNSDLAWFFKEMRAHREREAVLDTQSYRYYRRFSLAVSDWGDREEYADAEPRSLDEQSFSEFYINLKQKLQQKFAAYEERPAQEQMIEAVYETLQEQRHLLVEAGTGTGKSLAYLIAGVFFSLIHEQKIVVSTHTINLMEQLITRDVPLLQEIWPEPFKAAIVKGRNHYLCLRKFEQTVNGNEFIASNDFFITAAQMIVWLNETKIGDDEELQFWQKGRDFWKLVESDSQSCLNRACPWYKKCFYHRSRNEANRADVIITNHSLIFADIQTDNKILPPYQQLVVDEAHHFEAVAGKHFGIELTYPSILLTLQRLYRDARNGQLSALKARFALIQDPDISDCANVVDNMITWCVTIKENWEQLNEVMFLMLQMNGSRSDSEAEQYVYRLKTGEAPYGWDKLQLISDNITVASTDLFKSFEKISNILRDSTYETDFQGVMTDLGGTLSQLQRQRDGIGFFFSLSNPEYVYWLEASGRSQMKSLHYFAVPVEVSSLLRDTFFAQKESVILTSATLAVDRSFHHLTEQLGLDDAEQTGKLQTMQLTSPFQYDRQALVCIPNDFPAVKGNSTDPRFVTEMSRSLTEVARVTDGRMLVLFTSNRMLRQVYEELNTNCKKHGIQVLAQNVTSTSRAKLTRMFREQKRSILLGTSSFWEGVDIPGEALSCLAIVRLPFQPPNHPLFEAKSESLKKQNKNSFMQLAVPQAVIRFKQGFGRLIRTASDRGIVLVYDTRVIDTKYGQHFLRSLPSPRIEQMPTESLPQRIQEWLQQQESLQI